MGKKFVRVVEIGNTNYVCLPVDFVRSHGIKAGDFMERVVTDNSVSLKVVE